MTDLRALHQRALDDGRPLLDRVGAADLDRPTPCAGWDLRALVAHLIGQNHGFAEAVDSAAAGVDAPERAALRTSLSVRRLQTHTIMHRIYC